jgi:predicted NBD/HSP70 family sugar kinase
VPIRLAAAPLNASRRRLLALLECHGPLTRAQLAELSGLPPTTVSGIVADLLRTRRAVQREPAAAARGAGRPARTLEAAAPPRAVAVVGLRDGRLRVAVATLAGSVLAERSATVTESAGPASGAGRAAPVRGRGAASALGRAAASPPPRSGEASGLPEEMHRLMDRAVALEPSAALLLATLRDAGISAARLGCAVVSVARPRADEVDVAPLAERLGVPVVAENDANLGALGEAAFGAGRGLDSFVYVMLGHGVGAGLVFGGRLHRGATGFAGELGHVQVLEEGGLCLCGGRGCLRLVVGPSLLDFAARAYAARLSVAELLSLAAARDPGVRRVFADLGRSVGRPLATLCTMLDPAAVVVDGSLGAAGEPVMGGIREAIDRHATPVVADSVRVLPGELGDRAWVLGGVALARRRALDAL